MLPRLGLLRSRDRRPRDARPRPLRRAPPLPLIARQRPDPLERAAIRWHGRLELERSVSIYQDHPPREIQRRAGAASIGSGPRPTAIRVVTTSWISIPRSKFEWSPH